MAIYHVVSLPCQAKFYIIKIVFLVMASTPSCSKYES